MSDELAVVVGARVAGRITRVRQNVTLTYDDRYLGSAEATPLSVSMPVTQRVHHHAVVAPWLDGLLPDSEDVRRSWGRRFSVSAASPFSLLSTPVGEDCAGAARFITTERLSDALAGSGSVDWLTEAQVADRIRDLTANATAWLGNDFTGRFSLAGAQAKTALLLDPEHDRWGVPAGAASTSHILKPAIVGLDEHDLNEHLCLRAAGAAGLLVAPTRVVAFEDQTAIAVTRYDRAPGMPWLRRVHQEDACQALGVSPATKYQNEGGPTPRDLATLLRRVLRVDRAEAGVWQLFDALTYNWLIGGTDAHAKNYSLLLSGRQVALAPLYDVASTLPYDLPVQKLRLAMKYGGDYSLRPRSRATLGKVATELSLPRDAVLDRVRHLADTTPEAMREAAAAPDVRALRSRLPSRLVDLVATRAAQCRKALDGAT